ncbi:hypothetical protein V2J09_015441 [Rumex salicifolius]
MNKTPSFVALANKRVNLPSMGHLSLFLIRSRLSFCVSRQIRAPAAISGAENQLPMPRYKDEAPAVRVYTVCDESKYLIIRNVPSLGCQDELQQLFAYYGEVEECKPMDAEDCEEFTDVYWIKFHQITNARFAKKKLDEHVFLGNRLQVSYAPNYESLADTKEKLEGRRKEILARLRSGRSRGSEIPYPGSTSNSSRDPKEYDRTTRVHQSSITRVSSDQDYFPSSSMNETVRMVRDKLDKMVECKEKLHQLRAGEECLSRQVHLNTGGFHAVADWANPNQAITMLTQAEMFCLFTV